MQILSCVLSGFFAATAGVFGKYAFMPQDGSLLVRVLAFGVMLALNSLMLKYLMESYKHLGAGKATVVNFTCNYILSAAMGYLFYSEAISTQWLLGATTMLVGVYIITQDSKLST
mmetsp:Transcript_425/g.736  ORF Transcript_425/g.736 Transcript_425/m.736 type:complete len:115 (+) Transcript_425:792-1136(+)